MKNVNPADPLHVRTLATCLLGVMALSPFLFVGCGKETEGNFGHDDERTKLIVVATTTHVADMVRSVAGDRIELLALMGPRVDPHLYKPSARDAAALAKADLVFYSGLMLEGRMADLFAKAARSGVQAYAVTEKVPQERLLEPEEFEGHWDPHVWFDPLIWASCIEVVREGLVAHDPQEAEFYQTNAESLRAEYLAIHDWAKSRLTAIPEEDRKLITSHDAFNYFGRAFDFEVIAVQGISTATEAGLADRAAMVDYVKSHEVKAIFVESSVNPAIIQEIASEAGVKVGGELFSDAMGESGQTKGPDGEVYDVSTWTGMMKHNLNVIVEGLK
ncbi:MAG: ABC transporter substrate-binding protein [Opitutae bacterium]|nr:ABC transporter substrate-binding protein [Opitutae bacterium]|tara:strand:+ start:537 stop:1529 length:993 start_codon:yes stop_codon:yes gene_type:complete